jgi:hypothetical protein
MYKEVDEWKADLWELFLEMEAVKLSSWIFNGYFTSHYSNSLAAASRDKRMKVVN